MVRVARYSLSPEYFGCVPGTARILKGEYISCYRYITSPRPSLMEASWSATETRAEGESERSEGQRCSGMATGYPVTVLGEEAVLPRQDTANARGDVQKPSQAGLVGRVRNTG